MRREDLIEKFTHHQPNAGQQARLQDLRAEALKFALFIDSRVIDGPDKAAAIRKLRECVMTASAAIVLEEQI
jgi:hypothetical protein